MEAGPAQVHARARGSDRMSPFGNVIPLSGEVDVPTAKVIDREGSDGVSVPAYCKEALKILSGKMGGKYLLLRIDESYEPPIFETRDVYGLFLHQQRSDVRRLPKDTFNIIVTHKTSPSLPEPALRDMTVVTTAVKYTQLNSVCFALNNQVIGLGAGQKSYPLYEAGSRHSGQILDEVP